MIEMLITLLCISLALVGADQVSTFDHGIFRVTWRDEGKERHILNDVLSANPLSSGLQGPVIAHGSPRRSQSTSLEVNGREFKFNVNGAHAATAVVEEGNDNEVSVKVRFIGTEHLYGIPERATDKFELKDNTKYRLFNQDIFKYAVPHDQGLYGSIPFVMAVSKSRTIGFFWHNAADTSFTFETIGEGRLASIVATGGSADFFLLPGPTPLDVQKQFSYLTGKAQLPPLFSIGFHQCRWNYRSEEDVLQVDANFDKYDIPYDTIWLDIEHTDGKKYFTWDSYNFPNPIQMQDSIAAKGRKMVTITDPHIKRSPGYHVFDEASSKGYFVKNTEGSADYEGHCWPGTSSWIDFVNPDARDWYSSLFKYEKYKGSTPILYTWIDMNEPAVFNAHEQTFDMNNQHFGGVRHRDVHNVYGYLHSMAAYNGHIVRSSGPPHDVQTRPFVLTRSFFAGSQKYAAVWTGDNTAQWSHLEIMTPMLLSLSLSSLPFVGADIGGFFDNPEAELMVRWTQASAFTPFFRNHAHLETKRREPWLFGDKNTQLLRSAIAMRYKILPLVYTLFFESHLEGSAVINPLFFFFNDEQSYTIQDSFLLGNSLLVHPIAREGVTTSTFYAPGSESWFNFATGQVYSPGEVTVPCSLEEGIPVLQRAGSIVPLRERHRRSSTAQQNDPFTLQIAVSSQKSAEGTLFVDDTHSFKYQSGSFVHRQFRLEGNKIFNTQYTSESEYASKFGGGDNFPTPLSIERVRVFGWNKQPSAVTLEYPQGVATSSIGNDGLARIDPGAIQVRQHLEFSYVNNVLVIRRPQALIAVDWIITIVD